MPGGYWGDELGAHSSQSSIGRDGLRGREECLARKHRLLCPQFRTRRQLAHGRSAVVGRAGVHEASQRAHKPLDFRLTMRERDERHDPSVVDELDVDLPFVA